VLLLLQLHVSYVCVNTGQPTTLSLLPFKETNGTCKVGGTQLHHPPPGAPVATASSFALLHDVIALSPRDV
jgi:hypothetical protein